MEFIKEIEGAKNAEVNLVEIDGKLWVHKKEDIESTQNEKAFYKEMKANGIPSLDVLEYPNLPKDEIIIEYVKDSPTVSETPEDYELWGKTLKQLHNISYSKATTLQNGTLLDLDVTSHYATEINRVRDKILVGKYHSEEEAQQIEKYLIDNLLKLNLSCCLVHGDMHSANVLKKDNHIVLFDKSPSQWSFTPLVDLAIVMLEIPNGYLIDTDIQEHQNDTILREAFFKGYGNIDLEELRLFSQYQAARRINNSHEPRNPEIVKTILG